MPRVPVPSPKNMKKRPRMSIKLDRVAPGDFTGMKLIYACEHCSHFDSINTVCTMGLNPHQHTMARQTYLYNLTGFMAFCRFLEID